ncbi:helix-turn-helix domain-containing protein [Amphritea sp. 2_MG-2023]|uniref:AraC-like ligand-binding domain-containing protein n=1 Tax=Amphritea TaxID=515417 RepID=UPI001C071040|nr:MULTISPECIES: helix-turn-helix domain-containing protein [Amphritea]MBU2964193.1 helix-turn-helix domain-containing protein [Amphritea atlantica]MDO6418592.1 helix-turn-helix domain-containing protein [Amphritea sp. 2_MG-2023]MDX2422420.1 helix-turn-helix domain-containing protein [Amphritea sp.]
MNNRYSTYLLPQQERQGYWRNIINKAYFPLELDFRGKVEFHGHLSQWNMGCLNISRMESSATCFKRVKQQIDESEAYFLITIPAQEQVHFSQADRSVVCNPGSFILERSDLPYEFSYSKNNALWVVKVPVSLLQTRIRQPEKFLYMEFDKNKGIGNVFFNFLRTMVQQAPYTNEATHKILSSQLIDLLAYSMESDDRVLMSNEAGLRSIHLSNIELFVRENIQNPDLSPDMIALSCNISTRYLHKLFKDSDQTVSQWIKELRLQSALNDIRAATGQTTLAEISYRWGFNDQAHFCRLFKSRFGCTPKDMRSI